MTCHLVCTWLASKTTKEYIAEPNGCFLSVIVGHANWRKTQAVSSIHNPAEPADSPTAMLTAPNLILVPAAEARLQAAGVAPACDGEARVLGLGLMRRTVMAARRAGYGRIYFLARDRVGPAGIATIPDWSQLATAFVPSRTAPLIIAPAAILSESDWLERLAETRIEPAAWAALPNRIIVLAA